MYCLEHGEYLEFGPMYTCPECENTMNQLSFQFPRTTEEQYYDKMWAAHQDYTCERLYEHCMFCEAEYQMACEQGEQ